MELQVRLEYEDYYKFNKECFKKTFKIAFIVWGVATVIAVHDFFVKVSSSAKVNVYSLILVGGAILLFMLFFLSIKSNTKKIFESDAVIKLTYTYQISDDMIEVTSERGYLKLSWQDINRVIFCKSFYAFFTSATQAYIIPKRVFKNNNEEQRLVQIILRCLPESKVKK